MKHKEYLLEDSVIQETYDLAEKLIKWNFQTNNGLSERFSVYDNINGLVPQFNIHATHKKNHKKYTDIDYLQGLLLDDEEDIFIRYRALFTLREINSNESIIALC